MKLLVISYERLIVNGSAGTTVMCGLVEAALNLGWEVFYLGLVRKKEISQADIRWVPEHHAENLKIEEVPYSINSANGIRRFIGRFDLSVVAKTNQESQFAKGDYDGTIAFDSLPIGIARNVRSKSTVAILGDPTGKLLWHSTRWSSPMLKLKAVLLQLTESRHFRRLFPTSWKVAMFGSGHVNDWSRALRRKVIDIRPFIPSFALCHMDVPSQDKIVIAFGGTLAGTASRESMDTIFNHILPALRNAIKRPFELRLIGECPDEIKSLVEKNPEVIAIGRVDSFEYALSQAHVFILPMNYPVGVRTRVCSALAAGNACIVHSSVLYNMPELKECSVVHAINDASDYPGAIDKLVNKRDLLSVKREAQNFFHAHYAFQVSAAPILDAIKGDNVVSQY